MNSVFNNYKGTHGPPGMRTQGESYLLEARGLTKSVPMGKETLSIVKGVSIGIKPGEAVSIVGPSGSGKSTLLHLLGTLDKPNSGELFFAGEDMLQKSEEELALFRNKSLGFVFQFHHLLPEFTALENVMMPVRLAGGSKSHARDLARDLLVKVGLESRQEHFPSQMSGGELQRVAVVRALVNRPKILMADEPTGNLDTQHSYSIQNLFFQLKETLGLALVVVTHDERFARRFGRVLRLNDGQWVTH